MAEKSRPDPAPKGTAPQRAVAKVEFSEPVFFEGMDWVRELIAGKEFPRGNYPGGAPCKAPPMHRDADSQELVIGEDRFPLSGGLIRRYRLARAAS